MEIILYTSSQRETPAVTVSETVVESFSPPEILPTISDENVAVFPADILMPNQPQVLVSPFAPEPVATITVSGSFSFTSVLKNLGYGLILGSVILFLYAVSPILRQEISYRLSSQNQTTTSVESPYNPMFEIADAQKQQLINDEAKKWNVPLDFSIVIPKISAAARIIPNVNPADENAYVSALKEGVAHAAGSNFPGGNGTIYLFSHSTNSPLNIARYNAVFYLVKELQKGDEIIIFYSGRKFTYKVTDNFITTADDVKWLTDPSNEERLILQTCWPPGTSAKRLIVIAKPA